VHVPAADLDKVDGAVPYRAGDVLPGGVEAKAGYYPAESVLWIPAYGALVSGDTLLGDGNGGIRVLPASWLDEGTTRADVAERLRPLLELPVELILPTHGEPVTENALGRLREALA
jgi:glyoxylase-like metal-dependent hydrolase (beta-lactamase superfamily II)